jgi:L-ascorbate metabolism protein UlaG (beta-lactamase superfamily)
MKAFLTAASATLVLLATLNAPAFGKNVKLTTLGSHTGEMCGRDRAMLFEDPDGTTLLFDAGRTVMGPDDSRLPATLNVVLVSSVHGDHQGDSRIPELNAGTCKSPKTNVKTTPNSNSAAIAAGKKANIVSAGQMRAYLMPRMIAEGVDADTAKKLVKRLRPGGKMKFGGVTVAAIPTVHANGASPAFVIDKELAAAMKKSGISAHVGPDSGFILKFSNGLVVYLSADTGHTADMEVLVRRYYGAKLAIMNMGDINTMGPEEAAWAVNELIKPKAAMPTHANEESTKGGKVIAGSKVDKFLKGVKDIPVYIPLSGKTFEFDGDATCVKGC